MLRLVLASTLLVQAFAAFTPRNSAHCIQWVNPADKSGDLFMFDETSPLCRSAGVCLLDLGLS